MTSSNNSLNHSDKSMLTLELPSLVFTDAVNLGIPTWKANFEQQIDDYLAQTDDIRTTIKLRSHAVDLILTQLFKQYELDAMPVALFAVGGYGRQEMLPFSDVDIMVLTETDMTEQVSDKVQQFVTKLWDVGLDAGVSVRTVADCVQQANDITVATCLLESRLVVGMGDMASIPKKVVQQVWSIKDFYDAKNEEQKQRFRKHNSTEYNLEPDIKNAPGGLRDIHYIGWICKSYFRINKLSDLVHQSFMTNKEYDELEEAENFLLTLRHHLHRIANRGENKLLFDYQREVAKKMGYDTQVGKNAHHNASIESLMRVYYRKAMRLSTLNEMLNAYFFESLIEPKLSDDEKAKNSEINERFKIKNNAIAVTHSKVFTHNPSALLEIFVLMGQENIKHIRAKTLRLLKSQAVLIDTDFRENPQNKALFMSIVAEPNLLFQRLRKMKRYGILGRYLPAFEKVTGLMQYDLFHRYTVDAHTLLLTRILYRFTDDKYQDTYQTVGGVYKRMERKDLIHLSAIFHDIAKGRGGDHSELGATDAYDFCIAHGLPEKDAKLVSWLVENHLLMSITAQKRDISDPEVVNLFAKKVGNMLYLNHLYVLTVADMTATNPELWNTWRASLMQQLFKGARRMLRAGLDVPVDKEALIAETQANALAELKKKKQDVSEIQTLWAELGDDYFLKETHDDIVWQTLEILHHNQYHANLANEEPLVCVREHNELALDAIQVFVYVKDMPNLFASTVNVFNSMNLDVQDARIITATRDFALDSYVLIDRHGTFLKDERHSEALIESIKSSLKNADNPKIIQQRMPRRLKHFNIETKVRAFKNEALNAHDLVINALDQPGLLAIIASVFLKHDIEVHSARITTLGEQAEDIFVISDHQDQVLSDDKIDSLIVDLIKEL